MYFSLNIYRYSTAHPASVYSTVLQNYSQPHCMQECTVLQECTLHDKFWPPLKTTPPQLGVDTMKHCAALLQGAMAWYCSVASSDSVSLGHATASKIDNITKHLESQIKLVEHSLPCFQLLPWSVWALAACRPGWCRTGWTSPAVSTSTSSAPSPQGKWLVLQTDPSVKLYNHGEGPY